MSSDDNTASKLKLFVFGTPEKAEAGGGKQEASTPLAYLSLIRGKFTDYLSPKEGEKRLNDDIDQNIREIRALLAINDEIFERCMVNATSFGIETTVKRYGFYTVKTRQAVKKLDLVAQPGRTQKTFDSTPLATLPDILEDHLVVKHKESPYSAFIGYEKFFKKSLMMLHDDALELFLPRLKDHLELVQVCLGDIDAWVHQPSKNLSFIDKTFGVQLELPTDIDPHKKSAECCYCKKSTTRIYTCDVDGSDFCGDKCRSVETLNECIVEGQYKIEFDIEQETEQARLQRFLHFLWG